MRLYYATKNEKFHCVTIYALTVKIHCNCFRITGKTNLKNKLTSLVSKFVRGNRAESRNCQNSANTASAEAMREQFRCCCLTTVLLTTVMKKINKIINREVNFLKNLYENPNVSVIKQNSHYNSSVMCP